MNACQTLSPRPHARRNWHDRHKFKAEFLMHRYSLLQQFSSFGFGVNVYKFWLTFIGHTTLLERQ